MIRTDMIRPVSQLLAEQATERADSEAFSDGNRSLTYSQLANRTAGIAVGLRRLGLERGERVVLYLDNSVETVESYIAVTRAALVSICVNPDGALSEIDYMVRDSQARAIITDAAHLDAAREIASDSDVRIILTGDTEPALDYELFEALDSQNGEGVADDSLELDEPAWMVYTSGTTGRPKGVLLSQRSCLWVVAACWAPVVGLSERDRVLCSLPLFHSYALVLCVLGVVATGASEYILPRFSVRRVRALLSDEPFTLLPGVPTMFHYLLEDNSGSSPKGLGSTSLSRCVSAGAIMPSQLNERFEEATGIPLLDGYGITETSTMVTINWPNSERTMGSCGLPLPGLAVRIIDPGTGRDIEPGGEGELWVRGPGVMLGYHNNPDKTAAALRDGWYRTGDLATQDAHGYLTISGRIKELIIRGGENVYPAEIERVILTDEAVADAAVTASPHDALGEVPEAFVVPRDPATYDPDKTLQRCQERLSRFKVPERVITVDQIPRTGSGKIMRHRLTADHESHPA